ncbi:MAG: hypothetical protein ACPL7J_10295, partial [Desulfomonilaceae bacterium]
MTSWVVAPLTSLRFLLLFFSTQAVGKSRVSEQKMLLVRGVDKDGRILFPEKKKRPWERVAAGPCRPLTVRANPRGRTPKTTTLME